MSPIPANSSLKRPETDTKLYWLVLALVTVILITPIWLTTFNPLVDYPGHLARAWAIYAYPHDVFLQTHFIRSLDPMPNLAIDVLVPLLLPFLAPLTAGKAFLSLIILLFIYGCHELAYYAHHRFTWTVPLAAFFVLNSPFLYGFVNSSFSLSLFLVTFALWLRFQTAWTPLRVLTLAALATITYLSHLSGFAFLALGIAGYISSRVLLRRTLDSWALVGFLPLTPAVVLQLYPWSNKVHLGASLGWSSLTKKAIILGSAFLSYRYWVSLVVVAAWGVGALILLRYANFKLHPLLGWVGAAFLAAGIVCPSQLTAGGGDGADARFIPPAMVFLLLAFIPGLSGKAGRLAFLLVLGAMLVRTADIASVWYDQSTRCSRMVSVLDHVNPRSRIYALFGFPTDYQDAKMARSNLYMSTYALIFRDSISSILYAVKGVQPLYFRDTSESELNQDPTTFDPAYLDVRLRKFDYVFGCNLDSRYTTYLSTRTQPLASGEGCALWHL